MPYLPLCPPLDLLPPSSIIVHRFVAIVAGNPMTSAHHSSNCLQRCFRSFRAVIEKKPAGAIVVRKNLFQSDPQLIEKVIRGALKCALYTAESRRHDPDTARLIKIEGEIAAKIYDLLLPGLTADGTISPELQKKVLEFVSRVQRIKAPVAPEKSITLLQ